MILTLLVSFVQSFVDLEEDRWLDGIAAENAKRKIKGEKPAVKEQHPNVERRQQQPDSSYRTPNQVSSEIPIPGAGNFITFCSDHWLAKMNPNHFNELRTMFKEQFLKHVNEKYLSTLFNRVKHAIECTLATQLEFKLGDNVFTTVTSFKALQTMLEEADRDARLWNGKKELAQNDTLMNVIVWTVVDLEFAKHLGGKNLSKHDLTENDKNIVFPTMILADCYNTALALLDCAPVVFKVPENPSTPAGT